MNASSLHDGSEKLSSGDHAGMRIAADGTWFHQGRLIRRQALVQLFSGLLQREKDGSYWLVTPAERARVTVEDAPFIATGIQHAGRGRHQRITFRTNIGDLVPLDANHPLRMEQQADKEEARPYIVVRDGLEARLARSVFYHLVELTEPGGEGKEEQLGVWSNDTFFVLGKA